MSKIIKRKIELLPPTIINLKARVSIFNNNGYNNEYSNAKKW